ncbi:ATP-binding protein [Akkermansiaceae bacterium]|nr:ATP-binding protein [Akkermansiaceae bacterium]
MPSHLSFVLVALLTITGLRAGGESSGWLHRAWQTEDGLPDNSVNGIAQTPDGFLWVATNGGILRFDGNEFSPLPLRNIPNPSSSEVHAMFLDRAGQLWIGMEKGSLIRIGKDSFHAFTQEEGLPNKAVTSMADDAEGSLWVAHTSGIFQVSSDQIKLFGEGNGIPHGSNPNLACDAGGQVWFACGGKLGRLSDKGFELVRDFGEASLRIAAARDQGLWLAAGLELMRLDDGDKIRTVASLPKATDVTVLFEDSDGATWIGSDGLGLFRFKDGLLEIVPTSIGWVDCLTQDRDGNIWAGTNGGGLNLITARTVELLEKDKGLPFASVRSVAFDNSGRIWVVSPAGGLAYKESGQWQFFESGDDANGYNCVAADPKGRIWIGTRTGGLKQLDDGKLTHFGKRDGLAGIFVRSILPAKNGDVWIATDSPNQLNRFRDGKITKLSHPGTIMAIRAMAEGADGTVWVGTADGRLLRVEGDRLVNEDAVEATPSIRTLHTTADGSLWIGFSGDGLGCLKDGIYRRYTTKDGLFDDYISQIEDDGSGTLWIAANRGLFTVSFDALPESPDADSLEPRSRAFGRNEGLPGFRATHNYGPASCRGPDGGLYFTTNIGLLVVHPERLHEAALPPPLVMEQVTIDGEVRAIYRSRSMLPPDPGGKLSDLSRPHPRIEVPPGHDRVTISYAALGLGSPENVEVRYRLKPLDTDWQKPDSRNFTSFTRLAAGRYEFQLIACNSEGIWNHGARTLEIVVHPFFWETLWFRIGGGVLTVIASAGLVFLTLRRRHRDQLQRMAARSALEEERSRIARDIHDDLGASLTRISLLSQPSGGEERDPVLDQIQTTTRHLMRSMDEVVWAISPEHDTFDDLASYVSAYAQDLLSIAGIRCRLDMPMDLPEYSLSSQLRHNLFLAFKEALNNAVKYSNASEVRISISIADGVFCLKVADNGGGIDANSPAEPARQNAGSGLQNMTGRMNEIGGSCTVSSSANGTLVEFSIPFRGTP